VVVLVQMAQPVTPERLAGPQHLIALTQSAARLPLVQSVVTQQRQELALQVSGALETQEIMRLVVVALLAPCILAAMAAGLVLAAALLLVFQQGPGPAHLLIPARAAVAAQTRLLRRKLQQVGKLANMSK
jgi:hypothetical protein